MKPLTDDTYPEVARPLTVEASWVSKKDVLTRFNKLGLEIKLRRLGVEINPNKLGVEMKPLMDDTYPDVPRPLTVDANWVSKKDVLTRFNKLGLETKLRRLGVET